MTLSRTRQSRGTGLPQITGFYDDDTGSIQYLVANLDTCQAALMDTVLSFDPKGAAINSDSVEEILDFAKSEGLEITWILDTHPHADHLIASSYLKKRLGKPNAIGAKVLKIAELWRDLYNMPDAFDPTTALDHLFEDGDSFQIGSLPVKVMLSPGHTLGSITYVVGDDAAFVHDTFMQPDAETACADFPGGTAVDFFGSLQDILSLPEDTRLFVGHDYGSEYRKTPTWESTVAEQRHHNIHVGGGTGEADYIDLQGARDKALSLPDRMLHVLQMNLRAGALPPSEDDDHRYLKIPLNRF